MLSENRPATGPWPKISVVTIFFDAQRFIAETLESVLAQTYVSWELLLIDDGSNDGSCAIAHSYASRYPGKIRTLEHPGHQNLGMSAARNLGIRHAEGEYVAFLDADDVWLPHTLEQQLTALERQPDAAMVYGTTEYWHSWTGAADAPPDSVPSLSAPPNRVYEAPALLHTVVPVGQPMPCNCAVLARRRAVEAVGGFEDRFGGLFEDQVFLAKMYTNYNVLVTDTCWGRYRQHPDSCCASVLPGPAARSKQRFLKWLASYLTAHRIHDAEIWAAMNSSLHDRSLRAFTQTGRTVTTVHDVKLADLPVSQLSGRNVERPIPGSELTGRTCQISGWVLGRTSRIETVEVAVEGSTLAEVPVTRERPDIRDAFPAVVGAEHSGFAAAVDVPASPALNIEVRAVLSTGTRVPLGTIAATTTKREVVRRPHAIILLYHRVGEVVSDPWELGVSPFHFRQHLEVLQGCCEPISLRDLIEAMDDDSFPDRGVVVTFDDGYADNLHVAKPLLERFDVPATVFVTTGALDLKHESWWDELDRIFLTPGGLPKELVLGVGNQSLTWNLDDATHFDAEMAFRNRTWRPWEFPPTSRQRLYRDVYELLRELPDDERCRLLEQLRRWADLPLEGRPTHRSLTSDEVAQLAASDLIEIGAHTVTHPVLSALPAAAQLTEIRGSKVRLEELTGAPVESFAYPHGMPGDYTAETIEFVRQLKFKGACAAFDAVVNATCSRYELPRLKVQDWDAGEFELQVSQHLERVMEK